jgi:hypothetical protein
MEWCRVYYKGEGGGFPQVRAVVSLVCPGCPWFILAPKVLQLCTNHLVLVLCRSVWVNKACHIFLVPSRSSSTPFYSVASQGTRFNSLSFHCFLFGIHIWISQGVGGASRCVKKNRIVYWINVIFHWNVHWIWVWHCVVSIKILWNIYGKNSTKILHKFYVFRFVVSMEGLL